MDTRRADHPSLVGRAWFTPRDGIASMLAGLLVVGIAALSVRGLLGAAIPAVLHNAAWAPAVMRHTATVVTNLTEIATVLAALGLYFRLTRRDSRTQLGLSAAGAAWLPAGLLLSLAGVLLSSGLARVTGFMPALRVIYPGIWPLLLAFSASIHAGIIEELVFRGFLMQGLEAAWNRTAAIVVSALLFVLMHLAAPFRLSAGWWGVVTIGGLGLAWSYYAARRSLWLPIGLHWGFDLWVFLLFGLPTVTRGAILWIETEGPAVLSSQGGWVLLLAALLTGALAALALAACRPRHRT